MAPYVLAAVSAFAVQLLPLLGLSTIPKSRRPDFKEIVYYLPYIVAPFIGGLVGYAYFEDHPPVEKMVIVHVGASAPLILRTLATTVKGLQAGGLSDDA